MAVLSFIVVPFTLRLLWKVWSGEEALAQLKLPASCKCEYSKELYIAKKKSVPSGVFKKAFYYKVIVAAFLWYLWYLNYQTVTSLENIQSFDPFAILEVDNDADIRAIKKAYRRKSLVMHPDKNPDDPLAVQEFIKLTKAYAILTDETAYENFKKYGNPDGPGSYNVAIAMPRFLLQKENQVQVLVSAFFVLLVLIPGFVYVNFSDTTKKDEGGVLLENKRLYGSKLNENLLPKNMPQIMAMAIEYQAMGAKNKEEMDALKKLKDNDEIKELLPKTVSRNTKNMNLKPLLLILGHLHRDEHVYTPAFRESLNTLLKTCIAHCQMMGEVSMELNQLARMGNSAKKIGFKAYSTIIEFQQMMTQGLWTTSDPMLTLPGFDTNEIKKYRQKLRAAQIKDPSIETFCRLTPKQRRELNLFEGDKAKYEQLEQVIKAMPLISVSAEAYTEGEEKMTATDAITLKFTLKYDMLEEKETPGYVASRKFPFIKKQNWTLIFVDGKTKETIIAVEKLLPKDGNSATFELKQRFAQVGKFTFYVYFKHDSYVGFDKELPFEFEIAAEDKNRVIPPVS